MGCQGTETPTTVNQISHLKISHLLAYLSVFKVFSHEAIPGEMVAIWTGDSETRRSETNDAFMKRGEGWGLVGGAHSPCTSGSFPR